MSLWLASFRKEASILYRLTPLHLEDAVKVLVHSLKVTSDPELLASCALTAVMAELELDLKLLTDEEIEGPGSIDRLTDTV